MANYRAVVNYTYAQIKSLDGREPAGRTLVVVQIRFPGEAQSDRKNRGSASASFSLVGSRGEVPLINAPCTQQEVKS